MSQRLLLFVSISLIGHHAFAATFTVTNVNDSGPGSLRQAISDANATPNASGNQPDQIHFAIPGLNVQTITPLSPLPPLLDAVVIDGYTQQGTSPNTLALGSNAKLRIEINWENAGAAPDFADGIRVQASNCTLRGLVVNRFSREGIRLGSSAGRTSGTKIVGCYVGLNAGGSAAMLNDYWAIVLEDGASQNMIGGSTPGERNLIAGAIFVHGARSTGADPSNENTISGNYLGLAADGAPLIKTRAGYLGTILVASNDNVIGGTTAGAGNVVTEEISVGESAARNEVRGNLVGTTASGDAPVPDSTGVSVHGGSSNGGPFAINNVVADNVIGTRLFLRRATGTVVTGNYIGVARDGVTALGTSSTRVSLTGLTSGTFIGGTEAGAANVIAFADGSGIELRPNTFGLDGAGAGTANRISGNAIYANGGRGIVLGNPRVNDLGDSDNRGPNNFQNYPTLTSATVVAGNVKITGTLNSEASKTYRVEFFGNPGADASGHGEGQFYLGFTNVTTDAAGNASFEITLPRPAEANVFSSTATDPDGNTSEFGPTFFGRLQNISTRARVQPGDNAMIGGFIISGTDPKQVLVRAIGPSLEISGVPFVGRLEDPVLDLYDGNGLLIRRNDDWRETQQGEIEETGIAPNHDRESAIVQTLLPGNYTAAVTGKNGTSGVGVVEAYDLTAAAAARLANISTRSFVETGENVMIAGVIIGPGEGGARVLVRGIGPSLGNSGVPNSMQDPVLELRDSSGALRVENDDWRQNQAQVQETGAPPTDDRESALVTDLPAGNYTVILRGKAETTGVALVEVYHLQ